MTGEERTSRDALLVPAGFLIGFVASLCGIGGGLFAVPILHYLLGLELKRAVATGLVLVLATTSGATVTEVLRPDPDLIWPVVGGLVAGVLVGAGLGFRVSERLDNRGLKRVFVVVLLVVGARILFVPAASPDASVATAVGAGTLAYAFLAGMGGGFVAPLLGVGGGLIMVPALYLGLDAAGFSEARACSLAAGSVGALRSLLLHARAGRVAWRSGLLLGAGALLGAASGVSSLRFEGLVEAGRVVLGLILWATALRFFRDLRRASADPTAGPGS